MNTLRAAASDYLTLRRALGFKCRPQGMNPAARSSPSGPSELTGSHDSGVRIRRGMTALA
jgi:hypothetical protein